MKNFMFENLFLIINYISHIKDLFLSAEYKTFSRQIINQVSWLSL